MSGLSTDIQPFDVCGPLPTGVTVLEASAGTGKTFTIAALAARYVAEGTPLEQLLLVTFTRMATGELRERVRERLVSAEQGLDRALAGAPPERRRGRSRCWRRAREHEVAQRRDRLAERSPTSTPPPSPPPTASARRCWAASASRATSTPTPTFVEDVSDLLEDVVDDLYVRRFHGSGSPPFDRAQAMRIARIAVDNPAARVEPERRAGDDTRRGDAPPPGARRPRRARTPQAPMAVMTYDDLLTRLDDTLDGPRRRGRGEAPARALPRRARRRVPGHRPGPVGHHAPRLRGRRHDARPHRRPEAGDLRLPRRRRLRLPRRGRRGRQARDARGQLAQRPGPASTPTTRCSAARSSGTRASSTAGSGPRTPTRRRASTTRPSRAPLRIRVVHRDEPSLKLTRGGSVSNASAREHVAKDLAADLATLLSSQREDRDPRAGRHGAGDPTHPPRPRRRPRPHPSQRRAHPRRPRRGRHPRGHQRRGQRLRHRAGARLAAAARGDRAAVVARARRLGRAHALPGVDDGAGRVGHRGGPRGAPPPPAPVGARAARARASRR